MERNEENSRPWPGERRSGAGEGKIQRKGDSGRGIRELVSFSKKGSRRGPCVPQDEKSWEEETKGYCLV